jgi:hypothetical protein
LNEKGDFLRLVLDFQLMVFSGDIYLGGSGSFEPVGIFSAGFATFGSNALTTIAFIIESGYIPLSYYSKYS